MKMFVVLHLSNCVTYLKKNKSDGDKCFNSNHIINGGHSGSGSGLYSGGLTWSIVLRCDDHTGIFTCDGCARTRTFMCPPRHRAM